MLRTILLSSFLAGLVASTSLQHARADVITAEDIIAAIDAIDAGVNTLKADLEAYEGGLLSQTPITEDFLEIEASNRAGYAEAILASNFSASDSDAIVQAVQDTVAIDIPAAVQVLESKKSLFEAEDEDSAIAALLEVLLYDHESFSDAVLAHLTSDLAEGIEAVDIIIDAIEGGIEYYSS